MACWLPRVLSRIHELAAARRVRFTSKAASELAGLDLGLDEEDARDLLAELTVDDLAARLESDVTGEWMYIFKPPMFDIVLYVKVILRNDCVVVSFHEDEEGHEEDA